MTASRSISPLATAAAIALAALALAGCGDSSNATAPPAPPTTASEAPATVAAATTALGQTLVDSKGQTVYLFNNDKTTKNTCNGACASAWPPLRAHGKPTVGSGANASLLATTTRSDGKPQLTYNGHPLYRYQGDHKPGETTGQASTAYGAAWYALTPTGNQLTAQPPTPNGRSNSNRGSGY
jgi:predicted lipoprotein with Yx(FWY)xxD motif